MSEAFTKQFEKWGLREALRVCGLVISPHGGNGVVLSGMLKFNARVKGREPIADIYEVDIHVPEKFPKDLPTVRERGNRIPRKYHTNRDGTLCLGSPVRLHLKVHKGTTILKFIDRCVVPYLAGYSHYERTGGELLFGDLDHGDKGLIKDYMDLLHVNSKDACIEMLRLLGMRRRRANKEQCPCGSGRRVRCCHNRTLNPLRKLLGRSWCRTEYASWLNR